MHLYICIYLQRIIIVVDVNGMGQLSCWDSPLPEKVRGNNLTQGKAYRAGVKVKGQKQW